MNKLMPTIHFQMINQKHYTFIEYNQLLIHFRPCSKEMPKSAQMEAMDQTIYQEMPKRAQMKSHD